MIVAIVISILVIDQLTKLLVVKTLALNESVPVIKGVFHLSLVYNKGAAFGILKNQTPLFIVTAVVAVALIYSSLKSNKKDRHYCVCLGLILAGALGNLIDRILFGHVIDFLDFRVWPVFNIADSAITIGAIMLGLNLLKKEKAH